MTSYIIPAIIVAVCYILVLNKAYAADNAGPSSSGNTSDDEENPTNDELPPMGNYMTSDEDEENIINARPSSFQNSMCMDLLKQDYVIDKRGEKNIHITFRDTTDEEMDSKYKIPDDLPDGDEKKLAILKRRLVLDYREKLYIRYMTKWRLSLPNPFLFCNGRNYSGINGSEHFAKYQNIWSEICNGYLSMVNFVQNRADNPQYDELNETRRVFSLFYKKWSIKSFRTRQAEIENDLQTINDENEKEIIRIKFMLSIKYFLYLADRLIVHKYLLRSISVHKYCEEWGEKIVIESSTH